MKSWRLSLVLLLGVVCSAFSGQLEITDLGTLGGDLSGAIAINDSDQIIGWSWTTGNEGSHAFLYSDGQMTDLWPFLYAENINNAGQVSGVTFSNGTYYPAMYDTKTSTVSNLGSLGGVTSEGFAGLSLGISGLGQVVGYAFLPNSIAYHAFWYDNGVMRDLGCLPGSREVCFSEASDTNNAGQIVGGGQSLSGAGYAFLYDHGVMTNISPTGSQAAFASAINNVGQVVGHYSSNGNGVVRSFLYTAGKVTEIGFGALDTEARDINDLGQVVGMTSVRPENGLPSDQPMPHAFIFQNGLLTDLNELLPAGSEWTLTVAYAINNNGKIVGCGTIHGQLHAFVLSLPVLRNAKTTATRPAVGRAR